MKQEQLEKWTKLFPGSIYTALDVRKYVEEKLPAKFGWLKNDSLQLFEDFEKLGYDLYFTPNGFEELERKREKVKNINWWFADLEFFEKVELEKLIKLAPVEPNIVIETKNGFHVLWKIDGPSAHWDKVMRGIVEYFGSDHTIASLERTLRLPYFYHKKDQDHFLVTVKKFRPELKYSEELMLKQFPFTPAGLKTQNQLKESGYDNEEFIEEVRNVDIKDVIGMIPNLELKNNMIWENGKPTSAFYNAKENYVNRFSGKPGSGTAIDVVMGFMGLEKKEAIDWIATRFGIVKRQLEKQKPITNQIFKSGIDLYNDFYKEVQSTSRKDIISTGMKEIDQAIIGIFPTSLVTIAGETGAGKSQLAGNIAWGAVEKGKKVVYFDLENDPTDFFRRQVAIDIAKTTGRYFPHSKMRTIEDYAENEDIIAPSINNVCEKMGNNLLLYGNDQLPDLDSFVKYLELVNDANLVVVDHLHYFQFESDRTDTENIGRIMRCFRLICKNRRIPLICISHLRKRQKSGEFGNDDLFGSSMITKESETVIILSREQKQIKIQVTKARTNIGGMGRSWLAMPSKGKLIDLTEESVGALTDDDFNS